MKYFILNILFFSMIFSMVNFAHEDHEKKEEKPDTVTVVNGDTIAINGIAVSDSILALHEAEEHEEEVENEGEFKLNFMDVMFEHVHNKIIHFPISLAVAAFLFALFGYKDNRYESTIKILLIIAGLFAIIAFITGTIQIGPFMGEPKEWLANTHRIFGILSAISIWLWYFSLIIKPFRKFKWVFAIITVILISITGFYGGVLAH